MIAAPLLHIVAGIHEGVRLHPDAGDCVLGSSRQADLVLSDDGVAPEHVRLRFYGKSIALDAVGGSARIIGRCVLAQGQGCRLDLPAEIEIGGARLAITVGGPSRAGLRRVSFACATLILLLLIPMVASGTNPDPQIAMPDVDLTLRTGSIAPAAHAPAGDPSLLRSASLVTDPVSALRAKASAAGLTALAFEREGTHVSASGSLTSEQNAEWSRIQQWFDGTYGDHFILTNRAASSPQRSQPRFSFQAVWFGDRPYVIAHGGERLYPGAALGDGWSLKAIDEGRILVVRGREEIALTL